MFIYVCCDNIQQLETFQTETVITREETLLQILCHIKKKSDEKYPFHHPVLLKDGDDNILYKRMDHLVLTMTIMNEL